MRWSGWETFSYFALEVFFSDLKFRIAGSQIDIPVKYDTPSYNFDIFLIRLAGPVPLAYHPPVL